MAKTMSKGRLEAREILRTNPYLTNKEVARRVGVSPRTVASARQDLVSAGKIPRHHKDYKSRTSKIETRREARTEAPPLPPLEAVGGGPTAAPPGRSATSLLSDDVRTALGLKAGDLDNVELLTEDEALQMLSALARKANRDGQFNIAASILQNFLKLQQRGDETHKLGPGEPLTDEDKIARLATLIEICGFHLTVTALKQVFPDIRSIATACPECDAPEGTYHAEGCSKMARPPESADTAPATSAAADPQGEPPHSATPNATVPPQVTHWDDPDDDDLPPAA